MKTEPNGMKSPEEFISELKRQRDVHRAHLAWIENMLRAAQGVTAPEPIVITPEPVVVKLTADSPSLRAGAPQPVPLEDRIAAMLKDGDCRAATIADVLMEAHGIEATADEIKALLMRDVTRFRKNDKGWWSLAKKEAR